MASAIHLVSVEFGDCDPAGIVFYPNFYRWFDAATHHLLAKLDLSLERLRRDYGVVGMPLLETGAKYHSASRFGDRLAFESSVLECGRKTIRIRHCVKRSEIVVVEGFELRVFVVPDAADAARQRALELPEAIRTALA